MRARAITAPEIGASDAQSASSTATRASGTNTAASVERRAGGSCGASSSAAEARLDHGAHALTCSDSAAGNGSTLGVSPSRASTVADVTEGFDLAVAQHGDAVEPAGQGCAGGVTMTTVTPRALSSASAARQRRITLFIEIGIRLVEHQQPRLAVQRARQRDALPLSAGKQATALADLGVVAVRQLQDQVVRVRQLRSADHRFGIRLLQARDVGGDAAREQLHVLRQIARWHGPTLRGPSGRCRRRRAAPCRPGRCACRAAVAAAWSCPRRWGRRYPGSRRATPRTTHRATAAAVARRNHTSGARCRAALSASAAPAARARSVICRSHRRRHAARDSIMAFQPPISSSTGCSARPSRMVAAIMMPGEASRPMTSQAPKPSAVTCRSCRAMRAMAPSRALVCASSSCARCCSSQRICQSAMAAPDMPMATTHSALRSSASARRCEARAAVIARSVCRRVAVLGQHAQPEQQQRAQRGDAAQQRMHDGDDQ